MSEMFLVIVVIRIVVVVRIGGMWLKWLLIIFGRNEVAKVISLEMLSISVIGKH